MASILQFRPRPRRIGSGRGRAGLVRLSGGLTVTGGGGGSATMPDIYPNDGTYGWVFAGANTTAQSGLLTDADGSTPFLTVSGFTRDATAGPNGIVSVSCHYPVSAANSGDAFYYNPYSIAGQTNLKKLYVRFFYKQDGPHFNYNGVTDNQDDEKILRLWNGGYDGTWYTPVSYSGAASAIGLEWDQWDGGCTLPDSGALFKFNDHIGQWNCYEFFIDISVSGVAHTTIWLNDTQIFDNVVHNGDPNCGVPRTVGSAITAGVVQFLGVMNSMASASVARITMVGISSQRMFVPPGFTFPA